MAAILLSALPRLAPSAGAHAPHAGLDFSMAVDTDGDTVNDCGTGSGEPTACTAPLNGPVRAREYLNSLGDIPAYRQLQLHFGFTGGVVPDSDPDSVWPGCASESFYFLSDFGHALCDVAGTSPSVAYTGLVAMMFYKCTSDGAMDLRHGLSPYHTYLTGEGGLGDRHAEGDQTAEVLTVTCQAPEAYPTDTDGDTCPDQKEAGSNELAGGRRNFLDQFDYFNPSGDGLNRIDDVLDVVNQYFIDDDDLGYTASTDRTLMGPQPWNLGPPNGQQRVDDILNSVHQYFHDCS